MAPDRPTIFIIDDDASVRRSLDRVMASGGYQSESYESADEFLSSADLGKAGCIVADMTLVGMSGLDLKNQLNTTLHHHFPLIFLTAHDTAEMRAAAREAGAAAFFRKPVDTQALLDAIGWALHRPAP